MNRCEPEKINGRTLASEGACIAISAPVFVQLYDPVCGVDDITYSNCCLAGCSRMTIQKKKGACKLIKPKINCQLVKCKNQYNPGCAQNGPTSTKL